jgi:hypothetical protein
MDLLRLVNFYILKSCLYPNLESFLDSFKSEYLNESFSGSSIDYKILDSSKNDLYLPDLDILFPNSYFYSWCFISINLIFFFIIGDYSKLFSLNTSVSILLLL